MSDRVAKVTIETNDPTLKVDINKKAPTISMLWFIVGAGIVLVEAIYLLWQVW